MQKILTIVGARPQFIKASVVSRAIQEKDGIEEIILHTGQHFDENMSDIFFNQLRIPKPNFQLDINGGGHGDMTGKMLSSIEKVLLQNKPDRVIVYGDTNSTLAGALAAIKLHIPIAHVEAGLRSFNINMPEEVNRILTDQISDILFCPTEVAVKNLIDEGFSKKNVDLLNVGDVMQDAALLFSEHSLPPIGNIPHGFILTTLHRAENTDNPNRLADIIKSLNIIHETVAPVVIPLHPRTEQLIGKYGLKLNVHMINPVGYLEMLWLIKNSELILTDSGGLQKEAFFFGKACVTMRDQTEWIELVEAGANELVGSDENRILSAVSRNFGRKVQDMKNLYGGGLAASNIAEKMAN